LEDVERNGRLRSQRKDENVEKVQYLVNLDRRLSNSQAYYVEILKGYLKLCIEKGLDFGPTMNSPQ
jgi:hypothetical protein